MGRKNWSDKDTKVRGKGAMAKRQQDLQLAKVTKKPGKKGPAAKKGGKKNQQAKRLFEEPKQPEVEKLKEEEIEEEKKQLFGEGDASDDEMDNFGKEIDDDDEGRSLSLSALF